MSPIAAKPDLPTRPISERIVIDHKLMQVFDGGDYLRVVLTEPAPLGIRGALRVSGWNKARDGSYRHPNPNEARFHIQETISIFGGGK